MPSIRLKTCKHALTMGKGFLTHFKLSKLYTIMEIIGIFAISSIAMANTTPYFVLCEKILNQQRILTEVDALLLKKSYTSPVRSGSAKATAQNVKMDRHQLLKEGDPVNQWHAYFIGDLMDCFASPTTTMDSLEPRMNNLAQRQADLGIVRSPMHVFFMCSDANYNLVTPAGNQYRMSSVYKRTQNLTCNLQSSLILKVDERVMQYNFDTPSAITMIGAGDHYHSSSWDDDFTLAREMSYVTSGTTDTQRYYREALGNLRAFQLTGKTKPDHENEEVDIAKPAYSSIYSFYEDGHPFANHSQMATLYASVLYQLWNKMSEMHLQTKADDLIKRVETLLNNAYTSRNKNTSITEFKYSPLFTRKHAEEIFNFLASTSIQASIEQKLPFELTEWLCDKWEFFGVNGPFRRQRIYEKGAGRQVTKAEEQYNSAFLPDTWKNCDELISIAKPQHFPLHQ